jgi:hypothetical protein
MKPELSFLSALGGRLAWSEGHIQSVSSGTSVQMRRSGSSAWVSLGSRSYTSVILSIRSSESQRRIWKNKRRASARVRAPAFCEFVWLVT